LSKEKESVYLSKVTLTDYKSFKGENEFDLSDDNGDWVQWNILLGNNNVGKTNFLKAIALSCSTFQIKQLKNSGTIECKYIEYINKIENISTQTTHLGDLANIRYEKNSSSELNTNNRKRCLYAYGITRKYGNQGIAENSNNLNSATLFDQGATLINIEEWLFQLDYSSKNKSPKATERLEKIKELIIGDLFPDISDFKFETADTPSLDNYIEFQTKEGRFRLEELGYGYQSSMSWLIDFSKKMFERYPDSENALAEPAIVLIDEIDLHLHPSWQKNVIGFLSEMFPRTQFIVTTHSPQIKEGNATKYKKFNNHSFKGWSVEEILEEVMLIENGGHSDEYKGLLNKFDKALDQNNKKEAEAVYQKLDEILHPTSEERKILKLQLSQIVEVDD